MRSQHVPPNFFVDLTGDDEEQAEEEQSLRPPPAPHTTSKRPKFENLKGCNSMFAYGEVVSRADEVSRAHLLTEACRPMSERGFESLKGDNYVNDEVINIFLASLGLRRGAKHASLRILTSYFFQQYERTGYDGVQTWFSSHRSLYNLNLYDQDLVLVPINQNGHWTLACVEPRHKRCILFDSTKNSSHVSVLSSVFEFFQQDYYIKRQQRTSKADWTFVMNEVNHQQNDGVSCGLFVCRFAELVIDSYSRSRPGVRVSDAFPACFGHDTPAMMRRRIAQQIVDTQSALKHAP
jgi:Ulp1 family protease